MTMLARSHEDSVAQEEAARPLLDVRDLRVSAISRDGGRRRIVNGVDLHVKRGEAIAIVGESGSGKSLSVKAIARLLPPSVAAEGGIRFDGMDVLGASASQIQTLRGNRISMLLQDPFTMMNPLIRCGKHIEEMLSRKDFPTRAARRDEVVRRLGEVGIADPDVADRISFQLSGGMAQRVALAAALAKDPELLIADEPSTALDVTTQAEVMKLIKRLQRQRHMGLILITHDLRLAFSVADRVYVLYAGALLETAASSELEEAPAHPYTVGLLQSEPAADHRMAELAAIPGSVPRADEVTDRCAFAERCKWVRDRCTQAKPPLEKFGASPRLSACIRIGEIADDLRRERQRSAASAAAPESQGTDPAPLVQMRDVVKEFAGRSGVVKALKGVSLEVGKGESVGLVGESGSGKTTLGRCLVGLQTPTLGEVFIDGVDASDFTRLSVADRTRIRRTVQMIFQDPYSTLNPRHSVRTAIGEALRLAGYRRGEKTDRRVRELLDAVGLPGSYALKRPSELSGGERQRVSIARALAVEPRMLVCDESVSALDVSVQAQILNLLKRLQSEFGLAYLFITHDLAVVRQLTDRLYVLYRGEIVEKGPTEAVMSSPAADYTRKLLESIPGAVK